MLDPQTLSDLNIASLRIKLDYCQTTGGKEYLEALLKLQQITYPEILERQRIIKFICGQAGRWKMPIGEEDVFYVRQYLGSTYVALEGGNRIGRMISSLSRFAFHKEQYYFTLTGIKVTLRVVQEIVLLCRAVYDPAMPLSLKEKLEGVQEAAASLGIAEQVYTAFLHEEPNPMMVFNVDSRLRSQHRDTIADIRVRAIAEQIRTGKRVVVIGDELFKGTNVQDAVDCTSMVLQGFLKHERNFYFIATHFTTVAEQFEHEPGCLPICFDGKVVDGEITFDYGLKAGVSSLRIGSLILQQQQVINLLDPIATAIMPALK